MDQSGSNGCIKIGKTIEGGGRWEEQEFVLGHVKCEILTFKRRCRVGNWLCEFGVQGRHPGCVINIHMIFTVTRDWMRSTRESI